MDVGRGASALQPCWDIMGQAIRRALLALGIAVVCVVLASARVQFVLGGALVNAGYRMQDHLARYDLEHEAHELAPTAIWTTFLRQNELASGVRRMFPRSRYHPVIAMVACMDARLDTNELTGDTRRYYYVLRTAGSVMSVREQEMLSLAVRNGVRVVVFTTHTDCAAERAAGDAAQRADFPQLVAGLGERETHIREFLQRPEIDARLRDGTLIVRRAVIETSTGRIRAATDTASP